MNMMKKLHQQYSNTHVLNRKSQTFENIQMNQCVVEYINPFDTGYKFISQLMCKL